MEKLNEKDSNPDQNTQDENVEEVDPKRQAMKEKLQKIYSKKYNERAEEMKKTHQNIVDLSEKIENHTKLFNSLERIPEMLEHISMTVKLHRDLYTELEKTEGLAFKIEDVSDKLNNIDFMVTKKLDKEEEKRLKNLE